MVKTRIGLGCLAKDGFGSVELPENIELCCPQCGSLVADKGQCSVFFREVPEERDNHMTPNVVGLVVDCRACECYGRSPMKLSTYKFMKEIEEKNETQIFGGCPSHSRCSGC